MRTEKNSRNQRIVLNTCNKKKRVTFIAKWISVSILSYLVLPFFVDQTVAETHTSELHGNVKRYPAFRGERIQNMIYELSKKVTSRRH